MIHNLVVSSIQQSWVFQELINLRLHAHPHLKESLHIRVSPHYQWFHQWQKPSQDRKGVKTPNNGQRFIHPQKQWVLKKRICKC